MTARRICVVTGSRADYGLLYYPMRAIASDPQFQLQVAVTGMHLAPEFGLTVDTIERDGFPIAGRIETLLSSDTPVGIAKSIALGVSGFADFFASASPDLVLLLGDRFEILAAANAALVAGLPIGHLCGGDVTEGAYDEAIRHSITKMAHFHFVTNETAYKRVVQLGEDPRHVYLVGSSGLDFVRQFTPSSREDMATDLGADAERPWLLVTFHPVTRDAEPSERQLDELLKALEEWLDRGYSVIATQSNADNDGRALIAQFEQWASGRQHVRLFASLGPQRYLSVMAHCAAVVGNSSSGLYEAPSFKRPTINIGTRQLGRIRAASVLDCAPESEVIIDTIEKALALDCSAVTNPYGDGHTSERIVEILAAIPDFRSSLVKSFHDVEFEHDG